VSDSVMLQPVVSAENIRRIDVGFLVLNVSRISNFNRNAESQSRLLIEYVAIVD
jgi:hypothetical protein